MINLKTLYKRSVTAFFYAIAVIFLLNFHYWTFIIFVFIVSYLTAFELITITNKSVNSKKYNYIIPLFTTSLPCLIQLLWFNNFDLLNKILIYLVLICFGIILTNLFIKKDKYLDPKNPYTFLSLFIIGLPFSQLIFTILPEKFTSFNVVFITLLLIWANDSFAYLTGSMFGKHKLMPSVSPNKTIEGFLGGGILAIATSLVLFKVNNHYSLSFYIILGIIVFLVGTLGDLAESKLKRKYNLKDSGSFFPGHGGFLDRFDSFIFLVPFINLLMIFYK